MASQDEDMSDFATTVLEYAPLFSFAEQEESRSPRSPTWAPPGAATPFNLDKYFPKSPLPHHRKKASVPAPPAAPLPWIWQCHLCRNRYALGVTRRCLYDGHYYCSGETNVKNLKKKRKGQACSSEFDYEGWDEYGEWRRKALHMIDNTKVLTRCEKCDFPSMCRTPPEQYPVKMDRVSQPSFELPVAELRESNIQVDFQLPSAQELLALEEGEKEELLRAAGSSCAKADRSVDFERILQEAQRQEDEAKKQKQKQKQSKMTDYLKGKSSSKKEKPDDKRSASANLTLNLEQDKARRSGVSDFVMPSIDIWGKGGKRKSP
ncbi:uncharacterized protein HMPREF1541_04464 [Cyphellophora europaea CBS 101466]|uniref:Uncharacterized protein n=1 Tax=Cyphellophora europaea (strain CBS 101466) TaxID=1220924 RepID=W2RWM8_CYPE1|nr:uncharacterized protein HMPREF1541_04464 [Cyphellophora europaea CBS 101466]ETN40188.1 hypothetical protein HMPREF1541_04464 [Cyphellophora europaea CBS 101466]